MFKKILVANRGEIAIRIIKASHQLGIQTVAVFATADRDAPFVKLADEAICIGPAPATESYLNREAILMAGIITNCDALHPGYGFLSEDPLFAEMVEETPMTWIGPQAPMIQQFADKKASRQFAQKQNVPTIPGSDELKDQAALLQAATKIGYPLLLKASFGGGGKGIRVAQNEIELRQAIAVVQQEAGASFGASPLYLERDMRNARHIEVQVLGLGDQLLILGDRNCSIQLRRQKVLEESPAELTTDQRHQLYQQVHHLLDQTGYQSLGTVEFLQVADQFYFLEMNTRLQVEHGVTEETTGIDIVQTQIKVAAKQNQLVQVTKKPVHAIEVRINALTPGTLCQFEFPSDLRVETGYQAGMQVTPFYDALLAKVIVTGANREAAVARLTVALAQIKLDGVDTNLADVIKLVASPVFQTGNYQINSYQKLLNQRS
jgi:acetyl-CoA carboxylase biotin carboxylase subunit